MKRPKERSNFATPAMNMTPDANVFLSLKTLGYQQYVGPLADAEFTSMAEMSLITARAFKAANVLEGHSLHVLDQLTKRRSLGVVPEAIPADCNAQTGAFMVPVSLYCCFSVRAHLNGPTVNAFMSTMWLCYLICILAHKGKTFT